MTDIKTKNTKDYSKGKIYVLRNNIDDRIYIGSTCQTLSQRIGQHRQNIIDPKKKNTKLYQAMIELGKEQFYIELVEEYECENQEQLRKREGEHIRSYQSTLNQAIAGRTAKEWYQDNIDINHAKAKEYREANKDKTSIRQAEHYKQNIEKIKAYREANQERIKKVREEYKETANEKRKIWYQNNIEYARARDREYFEANKDKITARKKELRDLNRDKVNARKREWWAANKEKINARQRELYRLKKENKIL